MLCTVHCAVCKHGIVCTVHTVHMSSIVYTKYVPSNVHTKYAQSGYLCCLQIIGHAGCNSLFSLRVCVHCALSGPAKLASRLIKAGPTMYGMKRIVQCIAMGSKWCVWSTVHKAACLVWIYPTLLTQVGSKIDSVLIAIHRRQVFLDHINDNMPICSLPYVESVTETE